MKILDYSGAACLTRKHEATFLQVKANEAKKASDESKNASSFFRYLPYVHYFMISSALCTMCHKSKTRGVRDDVVYCDMLCQKQSNVSVKNLCLILLDICGRK